MISSPPLTHRVLWIALLLAWLQVGHAVVACGESNILSIETRALGASGESNSLTVDTRGLYNVWADAVGLVSPYATPEAMPFNDGVNNLSKYAFNLNATSADCHSMSLNGTSGWPSGHTVNVDGKFLLRLISVRRKNDPGLTYTACFSRDWINWLDVTVPLEITPIDALWERVTYQVPLSEPSSNRWFGQVRLTYLP